MEVSQLCLLVKHFPPDFTELEKRNLLKSYGAVDIRIMSQSGRLRNCAFATFPSLKSSRFALMSLHQLEMKGKRLVVEYAKQKEAGEHFARSAITETLDSVTALGDQFDRFCQDILSTTSFESCDYQANYIYPPPSPSIIANISRTLSMVPKFYIQVLHLMNRMCLPPPFGRNSFMFTSVTSMEEIPLPDQAAKGSSRDIVGMPNDSTSSEESELVSDEEFADNSVKRVSADRGKPKRKKLTLARRIQLAKLMKRKRPSKQPPTEISQIFQPSTSVPKKPLAIRVDTCKIASKPIGNRLEVVGTFGKVEPMPKRKRSQSEEMENYTNNISTALTLESLRTGRLTQSQMDQNVLFKNYNPGEPSCRLYVKNVAKQASQEELEQIFRIFVNSKSSDDLLAFDVRLMTTGRMKGQAFVSLKSIETAEIARQETNGFQLHGKPIVVCFARSNQLKQ